MRCEAIFGSARFGLFDGIVSHRLRVLLQDYLQACGCECVYKSNAIEG